MRRRYVRWPNVCMCACGGSEDLSDNLFWHRRLLLVFMGFACEIFAGLSSAAANWKLEMLKKYTKVLNKYCHAHLTILNYIYRLNKMYLST